MKGIIDCFGEDCEGELYVDIRPEMFPVNDSYNARAYQVCNCCGWEQFLGMCMDTEDGRKAMEWKLKTPVIERISATTRH